MIKQYFLVDKNEKLESIIEKIILNSHRAVIVVEKKKGFRSYKRGRYS